MTNISTVSSEMKTFIKKLHNITCNFDEDISGDIHTTAYRVPSTLAISSLSH